ncbi:hypothetical protein AAHC03_09132 [Spirometra sp. Aus1]
MGEAQLCDSDEGFALTALSTTRCLSYGTCELLWGGHAPGDGCHEEGATGKLDQGRKANDWRRQNEEDGPGVDRLRTRLDRSSSSSCLPETSGRVGLLTSAPAYADGTVAVVLTAGSLEESTESRRRRSAKKTRTGRLGSHHGRQHGERR